MKQSKPIEKIGTTTSQNLKKHTGKTWDQWFDLLNKQGAAHWNYRQISDFLKSKKTGIWWVSIIAAAYEVSLGRRLPGQSLKGTFSVIVTKTIHHDKSKIWKWLTDEGAINIWLKPLAPVEIKKGQVFETETGQFGEIRTLKKNERIRLSWHETDGEKPTIVQLLMFGRVKNKCGFAFQHSELKDPRSKNAARDHWKKVVDELLQHFAKIEIPKKKVKAPLKNQ